MRPSTDRVRETLFNWLGQNLEGLKCIDLFAGSGALGFEAASRQADSVILIERDKKVYLNLIRSLKLLQSTSVPGLIEIIHDDAMEYLKTQATASFNLVFIDPPFQESSLLELALIQATRICNDEEGGGIYIECPSNQSLRALEDLLPNWFCEKSLEAGQVKAFLFRSRRD